MDESPGPMQMLGAAHDILAATREVVAALDRGETIDPEVIKLALETNANAFSALLEHHMKIIDMFDELIAKLPPEKEDE